ncbi:MAG: phospholipase D-like domain-containing protein [Desulfurococcales archaeon]|nr:phospholipase D-like domain-containing protein [Desulfurococcales archaeon]
MRTYAGRGVGAYFANDLFTASEYIYVVSRWISPDHANRLVAKAKEGVEVKVLTSDDNERNHQQALRILTEALRPPRLIMLRRSSWQPPNMELGVIREEYLHVKMYVWDDKMAVVGSANFTHRGLWDNIEHIVVFDDPREVEMIKNDFHTLWHLYTEHKEAAREVITLEDIAKKIGKTVRDLASLFSRLRSKS